MASGRRKRLAEAVRVDILTPAGLSNYLAVDRGNIDSQKKLAATAVFASGSVSPSFAEGSTTVLSDAISNADANWSLIGYNGETTANASIVTGSTVFFPSTTVHRYMPYVGQTVVVTQSTPVVIYSNDGPQGYSNPAYLPTADAVAGFAELTFASQITGAAAGMPNLKVWVAGSVPTGTVGSILYVLTGAFGPGSVALSFTASTPTLHSVSIPTGSLTDLIFAYSASSDTAAVNSFSPGFVVYITGSAT